MHGMETSIRGATDCAQGFILRGVSIVLEVPSFGGGSEPLSAATGT